MKLINTLIAFFLPIVPKPIVGFFAKRYVAGSKLADAVRVVRDLNDRAMCATIDVLGENISKPEQTQKYVEAYLQVLDTIHNERLDSNISLKPTQMGLKLDKELCYKNIKTIFEKAKEYGIFARIDMEDSSCTSDTIELFLRLHQEFEKTGIVIQSYLRRSVADVKALVEYNTNFRICKGIYVELFQIAFKDGNIVNWNFILLTKMMLKARCYVGIATHDEKLVWEAYRLIEELRLKPDEYEFQMLLGVDEQLRRIIVEDGHRLRVYVPYGKDWYPYCVRRIKENPQMAGYVLKSLFGKK